MGLWLRKAYARVEEAYQALMAAPVTCPDDLLAKIEVWGMPVFEETECEEEILFAASAAVISSRCALMYRAATWSAPRHSA